VSAPAASCHPDSRATLISGPLVKLARSARAKLFYKAFFYEALLIHQAYLTPNMDPQTSHLPVDIHKHLQTIPVKVVKMQTLWEDYHPDSNIMKTFLYNAIRFMKNENVPIDRHAIESYLEKHPGLVQCLQEMEEHGHEGLQTGMVACLLNAMQLLTYLAMTKENNKKVSKIYVHAA